LIFHGDIVPTIESTDKPTQLLPALLARLSAEDDEDKRQERKAKRAADRAAQHDEAQIDRQLAGVESAIAAMTYATLYAAGCHKHNGQWRKKRHAK
jgi:hypothetical protein